MMLIRPFFAVTLVLILVAPAWAVRTQYWKQTSADDFNKGTLHNVVATNHGQLRLARQIDSLLPKDKHIDAIQAIALAPDGGIVFGAFPDGEVFELKDEKLESLAKFDGQTVTSLAYDKQGRLLIGLAAETGSVVRIAKAGDAPEKIFEEPGVNYIWAIVPDGDALLLATGTAGGVYEVDAQLKHKLLAQLGGDNVLCLLLGHHGEIYAGTDKQGLVYRIDRKTGKPYVMLNTPEAEVSALALDSKGNLLAATSDAGDAPQAASAQNAAPAKPEKHDLPTSNPAKKSDAPKQPDQQTGTSPARTAALPPLPQELALPTDTSLPNTPAETDQAGADAKSGNAVYQIDPEGFVTELFRAPVVIYGMAVQKDSIFLATGADGGIYELRPAAEEKTLIARTDAPDVTAILTAKDGSLILATSNNGDILKLSAECASEGTYESEVLDAEMVSAFGMMHLLNTMPEGAKLTVATRAGNVQDPEAQGWSDWSEPQAASAYTPLTSKPARFLQYRLTFAASPDHASPSVDEVTTAYQKPNVAPHLDSVTVMPSDDAQNAGNMTIAWVAADANEDKLAYSVYVREVGKPAWMELAKDTADTTHAWSAKGTADGVYEVKVVASDAQANLAGHGKEVSRVSDPVLFDNAPPVISEVKTLLAGDRATITLRAQDRNGTIAALDYTVDRVDHWQRSLPDDTIADSPEERYTVSVPGLAKGQHTVLVKVTDERGNAALETLAVNVP